MPVTADLAAFGKFAKSLEKQDATALRKRIRTVVNTVGADTLKEIRASASWSTGHTSTKEHPHRSVPAATSLRTSFAARSAGVTVVTNTRQAPQARPLEGGRRQGGSNRHPVYANKSKSRSAWTWVDQPTRPFFYKNAAKGKAALPVKLQEQLSQIATELGF